MGDVEDQDKVVLYILLNAPMLCPTDLVLHELFFCKKWPIPSKWAVENPQLRGSECLPCLFTKV